MPNSFPGWTSCATGCNEGKHGIFMPLVRRADNFSMKAMDSTDVRVKTVWEILSDRGRRSIVINDPCSYPPQKIDGDVVAGMTTPEETAAWTHPPALKAEILEAVPDYIVDVNLYGKPRSEILAELERSLDARLRAARYLHGFARVGPFLGDVHGIRSRAAPLLAGSTARPSVARSRVPNCHRRRVPPARHRGRRDRRGRPAATRVFVVSDHGFAPFYCMFDATGWLGIDRGYTAQRASKAGVKRALARVGMLDAAAAAYRRLRRAVESEARHGVNHMRDAAVEANTGRAYVDIDWARTTAYATLDGGIRVNLRGREPHGIVLPDESPASRARFATRSLDAYVSERRADLRRGASGGGGLPRPGCGPRATSSCRRARMLIRAPSQDTSFSSIATETRVSIRATGCSSPGGRGSSRRVARESVARRRGADGPLQPRRAADGGDGRARSRRDLRE